MRQADQLRGEIDGLEAELTALTNSRAALRPDAKQRLAEIEESLPRLRGQVAKLSQAGRVGI